MTGRARVLEPLTGVHLILSPAGGLRGEWVAELHWTRGALKLQVSGRVEDGHFIVTAPSLIRFDGRGCGVRLPVWKHRDELAEVLHLAVQQGAVDRAVLERERRRAAERDAADLEAAKERIRGCAGRLAHALRHLARRVGREVPERDSWAEFAEAVAAVEAAGLRL